MLLSVVLIMDVVEVEPATFVVLEHSPCTHLGIESFVAVGGADAIVGAYFVVNVAELELRSVVVAAQREVADVVDRFQVAVDVTQGCTFVCGHDVALQGDAAFQLQVPAEEEQRLLDVQAQVVQRAVVAVGVYEPLALWGIGADRHVTQSLVLQMCHQSPVFQHQAVVQIDGAEDGLLQAGIAPQHLIAVDNLLYLASVGCIRIAVA